MRVAVVVIGFMLVAGCQAIDDVGVFRVVVDSGEDGCFDAAVSDLIETRDIVSRCPPYTILVGSYCVDERPALLEGGVQGSARAWAAAQAVCNGRSGRLCTEEEREGVCPKIDRNVYCAGPAATWEWSAVSCLQGHRRSPCCNVAGGFGECSNDVMEASYHCCFDLL